MSINFDEKLRKSTNSKQVDLKVELQKRNTTRLNQNDLNSNVMSGYWMKECESSNVYTFYAIFVEV